MNIAPVRQSTPEWHALRASHFTASEAPAALGVGKYMTRAELLRQKATGLTADVGRAQQAVYDSGHAAEDKARPMAEAIVGELFPVTATREIDGLKLLASLDGATMAEDVIFEHKLWSEPLAAAVRAGALDPHYTVQMDQQLLVSGADRCLFMVSDGTPERMVWCWYESSAEKVAALIAAWKQFAVDLAAYVPPAPAAPAAVAAPVEHLPAVRVIMNGALTVTTNLDAFGLALRGFIDKIPAKPTTDQEFVDVDAACKALKRAEDALAAEEDRALAGMADVEQMRRLVADLRGLARTTRLAREKMVEARKVEIRTEEVQRGKTALAEFIAGLNLTIGRPLMPPVPADFALAIKGLRSLDSVRAAIDQAIADAKIKAVAVHQQVMANLRTLEASAAHGFLFPDMATLVLKAGDDLAAVIASRIADHQAKEAKRLEAERERIRAEEQAKAAAANLIQGTGCAEPTGLLTPTIVQAAPVAVASAAVVASAMRLPSITRLDLNKHLDSLSEQDLKRVLHFVVSRFMQAA